MNGASGIGWDENTPADTESLGLADDRMRSIKTSVRAGLDDEHNWPSAGGDGVGYHRYGSARPFYGTQSQVSSTATDGRLMMTSDTSRLFATGSTGTVLLGGPGMLSMASFPGTVPQRHHWVVEIGIDHTEPSSGTTIVTIPNSGYSGLPYIFLSHSSSTVGPMTLSSDDISKTTFLVQAVTSAAGGPNSDVTFQWMSVGTRAL